MPTAEPTVYWPGHPPLEVPVPSRPRLPRRVAGMLLAVATALALTTVAAPDRAGAAPVPDATGPSSPAVAASRPGRVDLFTRSDTGRLEYRYRPAGGSWTRPIDLGGALASQPAVVSWGPGRLDVFARGTDDRLWHRAYDGARWWDWAALGGSLRSGPAVASWSAGRLDVLVRGSDGALWHRAFDGTRWWGWASQGGTATSAPAVASWSAGRLDVAVRGPDEGLWHKAFDGGRWGEWAPLGGVLASQPAIAASGPGLLDVVVVGPDRAAHLRRYRPDTGWAGWSSLGGRFSSGPGAHADGGAVRVVGRAPDGVVHEATRPSPSGDWSGWTAADPYRPFRGLATWVDVFDYAALDPVTAVADMRARGVRTLYLSTARFTSGADFHDAVAAGRWLDEAHRAGLSVVGWYVPGYGDMARDLRRTTAIAEYASPGGQRFDAVGIDIERLDEVDRARFAERLVTHLAEVRARTDAMVVAIVPAPFTTDPGNNWAGFPWTAVGERSEVVLPMALWSYRTDLTPDQVHAWVLDQVQRARALTGRPVSVEGGVAGAGRTPLTADRIARFVDAARDGGAIGAGHYDYASTDPAFWPLLARVNG
ncbi:hypothetical protein [Pseudonocardia humida]|uniref:PLL-like beta propeller domain-containing protein n=1 Tax=Pseudonocardia humida TaxID=2800819 RepID=A0ABT1A006_9PSEU|nr:hypothetical protein [Pseudonocardia humida]MCO1656342.1 hypothetical protein [Pseudonocardia humida]